MKKIVIIGALIIAISTLPVILPFIVDQIGATFKIRLDETTGIWEKAVTSVTQIILALTTIILVLVTASPFLLLKGGNIIQI